MKYQDVLNEKGLDVDVLSRKMKAEIKRLEKLSSVVETISIDDLSENEANEYKKLLEEIVKLDEALAKDIKRFDLNKYKERVERVNKLNNKSEEVKETAKVEPKVEPKEEPKTEEELKIEKGLWELKQKVQVDTSSFKVEDAEDITQQEEQVVEEEIVNEVTQVEEVEEEAEEFEKVREVRPRKGSLSKIAVGVGALILTWGLVNILKEK
jgi:hypothetical protein